MVRLHIAGTSSATIISGTRMRKTTAEKVTADLTSIVDFADNIRSIQNAYQRSKDGDKSVSDFIASVNAEKDKELKDAMTAAITAIGKIPEPFAKNATGQATKDAINAVTKVSDLLSEASKILTEN